jgi:Tol biopolymer transport system component
MFRAISCIALFCTALPAFVSGRVEIVSIPDPGSPSGTAGAVGYSAVTSADGRYVAFLSAAPNMIAGQVDGNQDLDVFVHDRVAGSTTLISHAAGAPDTAGDGGLDVYQVTRHLALSSDGRWVAFISESTDLVPGQVDTAATFDAFVHDRNTGTATLVSHADGLTTQASGGVSSLVASQDGRWIAFVSTGENLVAGQTDSPGTPDVFLQDRTTGATTLVSHTASATQATGGCTEVEISADGSRVAFTSSGSGSESAKNVYLFDRSSGAIALVSHAAGLASTPAGGSSPVLSSDGSWVAFVSRGTNLVAGQVNGAFSNDDVFLYERASGAILLASHAAGSTVTTDGGQWPSLSADGRFTAYVTLSEQEQVRLYDRTTGAVVLVSHAAASSSTPGNQRAFGPRVSADGNWIAFGSHANNLVTGQTDPPFTPDAFLYNRATGINRLVSHVAAGPSTTACTNQASYQGSGPGAIAPDGSFVLINSHCPFLAAGLADLNTDSDLFVYDRASDSNSAVSVRHGPPSGSAPAMDLSWGRAVSHDGRYVAFVSNASNFVSGQVDTNGTYDVFLRDRVAGTTVLVSHAAGAPHGASSQASGAPVVSADGSFVTFLSSSQDLVPGQVTTSGTHLYLYERATGDVRLVDHLAGSPSTTGTGTVWDADLSGDGRWVVYWGMNLGGVEGVPADKDMAYLFDRLTGETRVVSASAAGFGSGHRPRISADGRYVTFEGSISGDPALSGLLLYDREAAAWTRISQWGQGGRINADGRWVAFLGDSISDIPGLIDPNLGRDVFLWDRVSGGMTLVSHAAGSPNQAGNAESAGWYDPIAPESLSVLSADGRYLVFSSKATDLVPSQSDTLNSPNLFLFDRVTGGVTLVDHTAASPAAASTGSALASISADGSRVAFISRGDFSLGGVYLSDTATGSLELVAGATGSGSGAKGASTYLVPSLSADGRVVAFSSTSPKLADDDMDGLETMFAWVGPDRGGDFFTVAPCRLLDTRLAAPISSGASLRLKATGSCGIPATAVALAVNVTVLQPTASGRLSVFPGDVSAETSTLNFQANENRANNATLRLSYDGSGTLRLNPVMGAGGTVHATVDVTGYYE